MTTEETDNESDGILHTLRSRYAFRIGLVVLAVTIVLVFLGVYTFMGVQASVQDDAEATIANAAEREAASLDDFIENRNSDTLRISSNSELTELDSEAVTQILKEEQSQLPGSVASIHLYNTQTNTIEASSTDGVAGTVLGDDDRPWANPMDDLDSASAVHPFSPYELSNEKRLGFTSMVDDGDETHVIVVDVDLEGRSEVLASPIDGGAVEVVSFFDREVILSQDLDSIFRTPHYMNDEKFPEHPPAETFVGTFDSGHQLVEGDLVIAASSSKEMVGWGVVVVAPEDEAFGTVSDVTQSLLVLIGVALLGLFLVGGVITRDINKSLAKTTGYAEEIESGNLDVDIDQTRQDEFGQLSGQFARIRDTLKGQIKESEQARKEAEVARSEAEELARYLQKKATEYSDIMQQVGSGDLTLRMEQDGEEDAMDKIADEFNGMIEELEKTTGQLKSYVDEVEESGADVEQSAMTLREASEQVAESIQKISDDAYDQKDQIEAIGTEMDTIADELEQIAEASPEVGLEKPLEGIKENCEHLDEIADLSERTMAESQEVAGAAEEQAAELNTVSERANNLQRYAQPLRDILERFETEEEHEFVFSVGPSDTDSGRSSTSDDSATGPPASDGGEDQR